MPEWVQETKDAEDNYDRRARAYGRSTGALLAVVGLTLALANYYQLLSSTGVEGVALSLVALLLAANFLEDSIIPEPSIPTYKRLATALYCIGEDLGSETKEGQKDLAIQLDRLYSLITKQKPELERKDLVFGVAVSVLEKLADMRKKLVSKSDTLKELLPALKSNLQALAEIIYTSKSINSKDIETVTDTLLANMNSIPFPTPIPVLQAFVLRVNRLSNRQALAIEVMVSLLVGATAAFVPGIGVFGGFIAFLAMVAFLDTVERRLRQRS